jgi:AraC family transcriptional regulator
MPDDHQTIPQTATEPIRRAAVGRCRVELLPRAAYEAAYTAGHAVIGFAFDSQSGTHAFASDRRIAFRTRPNSLAYVPAGCDVYSQSCEGGEYLTLAVSPDADGVGPMRRFNDRVDPAAIEAARALRRLLLTGQATDPLAMEHYGLILEECAARAFDNGCQAEPRTARWLTPHRLRMVEDLIEARLDGPLTVQDLADAVQLSAGFFTRAFKAATGRPPHAHILDRRIARARALLQSPAAHDLSGIACATGFSSHAHMTAAFRARLGVTPGELRG